MCFSFSSLVSPFVLHSFPTRRSSDLDDRGEYRLATLPPAGYLVGVTTVATAAIRGRNQNSIRPDIQKRDRKSTRLNSSHLVISYAVFHLKKKKNEQKNGRNARHAEKN